MNDKSNKPGKVAWHQRIDEDKISKQIDICIKSVQKMGFAITHMDVHWEGRTFTAKTSGKPIDD